MLCLWDTGVHGRRPYPDGLAILWLGVVSHRPLDRARQRPGRNVEFGSDRRARRRSTDNPVVGVKDLVGADLGRTPDPFPS